MTGQQLTVLVVGATGSVGRHVVATAVAAGHRTRALARSPYKAQGLARGVDVVIGDLTDAASLHSAVADIDAVIFTHGDNGNAEAVNYGAVKNVLDALDGPPVRIALMTTIGVTALRDSSEWKRRGERLVRASGNEYTIVRPGWFDYNDDDQLRIAPRQGDTHQTGGPADGVIARRQIARVLVESLTSPEAEHRTFELVAEHGPEQQDLGPVFGALPADDVDSIDGAGDADNLPLEQEPQRVVDDLARVRLRG
ncbi:SDR family NAD(P)-dependent oxidoreductase [Curtobacterium sp. MCSS17_008]|uniref:SDR family oxidoreductase n=1 Tax=Curtobacterium sp. MCSS17_008 TaxID=2175647 RepID=UPI000DA9E4E5|nr:SDR family oxidoreductase [Curtobacterium sp. MCSS17_008]PZF56325.1 SDR family NAD(P)-dependent oxidoreductase [Curtobacterium sp. MCSS17_008]